MGVKRRILIVVHNLLVPFDRRRVWLECQALASASHRVAVVCAKGRRDVRNDLQEVIDDTLVRGELVASGIIRAGGLGRLIQEDRAGREDYAKQICQLLTLQLWCRNVLSLGVAA